MECILHIGTEKTGSSTLQHFLSLNRSRLLKKGIAYTKTLGKKVNNGICLLSYPIERRDNLTEKIKVVSDTDFRQKQQKLKKRFKKEIKNIVKIRGVKKFIISSELIQSRLITEKDVQKLKTLLVDELGFDKIKVVIYLRDPALTAQSLFSTAIKFGHTGEGPPHPNDEYFGNVCNHKATLKRFGNIFGEDSLVIRLFQKEDLFGNSIITDFFHVLKEPISPRYIVPKNSNPSLSYTAVSLLSEINKYWPRKIGNHPNYKRSYLIKYLENNSTTKFKISTQLKREYDKYFNKSNEWVRKKYFPHRETLFYKSNINNNFEYQQNFNIEEVANLVTQIWKKQYKTSIKEMLKISARSLREKCRLWISILQLKIRNYRKKFKNLWI